MTARYVAQVYDRQGRFIEEREAPDLLSVITAARVLRADHPTASLVITNLDEVALGSPDGLTDDERGLLRGSVT